MHEIADIRSKEAAIDRYQVPRIYAVAELSLHGLGEFDHQPVGWVPISVDKAGDGAWTEVSVPGKEAEAPK